MRTVLPDRWLPCRNDSGGVIPPFAVMKVTGVDDQEQRRFLLVDQPDGSPASFYALNSAASIAIDSYGACTLDTPGYALYTLADGTPTVGQDWGATGGSWRLGIAEDGFIVLGDANNERVLVHQPGTGSSDPGIVPFELTGNMSSGAADGKQLEWSGGYSVTGSTLSFKDPFNQYVDAKTGHQGFAFYNSQRGAWEILSLQRKARFIRFSLPSAMATSDGTKASCTVENYWDGLNPGSTVTVSNMPTSVGGVYVFSGATGAMGLAQWDDLDEAYRIYQMECP